MSYQSLIRQEIGSQVPAHQVEAFMRAEHGTLDALTPEDFAIEARIAAQVVRLAGPRDAESVAASYGLRPES